MKKKKLFFRPKIDNKLIYINEKLEEIKHTNG